MTAGTPMIPCFFANACACGSSARVRSALIRTKRFISAMTEGSVKVLESSSLHGRHQTAEKSITTGFFAAAAAEIVFSS